MQKKDEEVRSQLHHLTADTGDAFATMQGKASSYFADLAKKGEDISDAVPGLIETYFSTHQVPAMDPAAEVLTRHWLNRGEIKPLLEMIAESEYTNSFSKALEGIAREGGDLTAAIPALQKLIRGDEYLIAHAVAAFCGKHPEKKDGFLREFARVLLEDKTSKERFFRFCTEMQYKGESVAALVPLLVDMLTDRKWQKKAATTIRWIHLAPAELGKVIPQILTALKTKVTELQENLAYIAGYYFLSQRDFKNFDKLHTDIRAGVITGVLYACRNKLLEKEFADVAPEVAGRVVHFLDHADRKIADLALAILETAIEKNKAFKLRNGDMEMLAGKENNPRAKQLLYRLEPEEENGICRTCEKIKRKDSYSAESSVPEAFEKFHRLGSHRTLEGFSLHICHECGMYYEYSRDEEYDDMLYILTIRLNRLNTIEAAGALPPELKTEHQPKLMKLEELWAGRLNHPLLWARVEAAWITAEARMHRREWTNLEVFFQTGKEIRDELKQLLLKYSALYADDKGLRTFLENKLASDSEGLEYELAKSLAQIFVRLHEDQSVSNFLEHSAENRRLAMLHVLWLAVRDGYGVGKFISQLKTLTRDKHTDVRRYARYVMDEAVERGEVTETGDVLELMLQELKSGDEKRIEDACDGLEKLAEKQSIAEAIPLLAEQLKSPDTHWHALRTIRAALLRDQRIDPAIRVLLDLISKKPYADRTDELWTIRDAQIKGHEITAGKPVFLQMLSESRTQSTAIEILRGLFEAGKIFDSDLPLIEKLMLKRPHDGYSEVAGYIVFDFWRQKKDESRMRSYLTHENRNVRGVCCSRMADESANIREIGKFLKIFVENMTDKGWYVRVCSGSCLEKYAKLGEKERQDVEQLVAKIPAGKKNKELDELRSSIGGPNG